MNFVLIIIICSILLIDFISLQYTSKKSIYIYVAITILILVVIILNKYGFFTKGPFEIWIEKF